jgi:hypothetical protein
MSEDTNDHGNDNDFFDSDSLSAYEEPEELSGDDDDLFDDDSLSDIPVPSTEVMKTGWWSAEEHKLFVQGM